MTQELACLLIGLAMLMIGNQNVRIGAERDSQLAVGVGTLNLLVGSILIMFAISGYISSLPSIKEVGR